MTDGATSGIGVTTLTSATGGFTAQMVGSIVHLYTGTNLTDGWYEITVYTDTNTVTLDRAPDDGVGGVSAADVKVGGALATLGGMGAVFQIADQSVAGMKAYVRGGTYSNSQTAVNISGGPMDLDVSQMDSKRFILKGYDAAQSRDSYAGSRPIIDANTNIPANLYMIEMKGGGGNYHVIAFIEVDGDSLQTEGIKGNNGTLAYKCIIHDCDHYYAFNYCCCINCYTYSNDATGFTGGTAWDCLSNSDVIGFGAVNCFGCISYNATTYRGFGTSAGLNISFVNCISYGSATDGFDLSKGGCAINCVAYDNAGYAYNSGEVQTVLENCAHYNTGSGRTPAATPPMVDAGAITLTADPFTNAAGLDFSLNNTAGGGALLRAAGISPYGQTGYPDVGAVQHEDAGGGGGGRQSLHQIESGGV